MELFKKWNKIIIIYILLLVFFFLNKKILEKDIKICLCVIAKNENLYVREFVEYYKEIGFNKIYIYDNNDKAGEKFEDVINDYIQNGFVYIINFRDRDENSQPIFDAYRDCYSRNNQLYDWLSFYDMDEFLELNEKYKNIQEFLRDKSFKHCQNIKINWLMPINDQALYYENKTLQQRIQTFRYNDTANIHIKSTVRGHLYTNYWEKTGNPHSSSLNVTSCSSSGKIIQFDSPFNQPPDFHNAKLKHYYYKSFEEFCIKIKRGKCDMAKNKSDEIKKDIYTKLYLENKNNEEKIKIIHKIFNEPIYNYNLNKI